MIKQIIKVVKKIVFSFGILYGINVLMSNVDVTIPINVTTLGISTVLGIPGILSIFAIYFIIK